MFFHEPTGEKVWFAGKTPPGSAGRLTGFWGFYLIAQQSLECEAPASL